MSRHKLTRGKARRKKPRQPNFALVQNRISLPLYNWSGVHFANSTHSSQPSHIWRSPFLSFLSSNFCLGRWVSWEDWSTKNWRNNIFPTKLLHFDEKISQEQQQNLTGIDALASGRAKFISKTCESCGDWGHSMQANLWGFFNKWTTSYSPSVLQESFLSVFLSNLIKETSVSKKENREEGTENFVVLRCNRQTTHYKEYQSDFSYSAHIFALFGG